MHSALVSAPPIYISVQRISDVVEDAPIYDPGTTGAFMMFGDAWIEEVMLDDGPTMLDIKPFEDDDDAPYTEVDEVDAVLMEDFLEEMNEIDAALDALFSEHDEDQRMYLIDRDGQRHYYDSGTALHAAARSQPRRPIH